MTVIHSHSLFGYLYAVADTAARPNAKRRPATIVMAFLVVLLLSSWDFFFNILYGEIHSQFVSAFISLLLYNDVIVSIHIYFPFRQCTYRTDSDQ